MKWKKDPFGDYLADLGKISMRVNKYRRGWGVTLFHKELMISISQTWSSAATAKRAAIRWAKRLQEGLK